MSFFKINGVDYSDCVTALKIGKKHNFKSMVNAAGNTLVKPLNVKRTIEAGFIPLNSEKMAQLQKSIKNLTVTISYRDPETNALVEGVKCMLSAHLVEYYTIQVGKVSYKPFSLQFIEL